mgnify:CR=1 FL=1
MKAKTWLAGWAVLVVAALGLIGYESIKSTLIFIITSRIPAPITMC